MKKLGLPMWLPYPSSWLNALILSVFMTGLVAAIRRSSGLYYYLTKWLEQPELFSTVLILLLLLPIPAIAYFHHFFLGRFIPAIPGERTSKTQGLFPSLISWWESLYSWLVFILSTLIATLVCTPLLPLFQLNYEKIISTYNQPQRTVQGLFAIVWILSAAIFYQIEYLFKCRLIFADVMNENSTYVSKETPVTVKPETPQTEDGATQIQSTEQPPKKKTTFANFIVQHRKLPKRIFTLVLISTVALWIYMFTNLPQVQQTISANISSLEKQSALISPPAPENSTFEQAMDKARYAANLTKSAQSQAEWEIVANRWTEAIKLLEAVPTSSPNYAMAQQKILQYQIHREFAKQMFAGG
ncbi:MAG: hypothetical protein SAK29_29565 [Scytonema sp. PMC 1069.18]|nr:hypothetical protein [Scytonema sp. PMC 1069.18]MEC4884005.1 hypothetical protein [Scytonema sp. PMC 1070.18]